MWMCEYDRRSMRQNPILTSRLQVGGRPMPAWFSASLVNQTRGHAPTPPPPPLPTEPPPEEQSEESEYEEIEHLPKYSNVSMNSGSDRHPAASGSRGTCGLCGNPNPLVRCEMCNNQIFCGSCNDMYHRHPKRHNHTRKILEYLENRPPLPPKAFLPPQQPEHPHPHQQQFFQQQQAPVPPPRRNRRFGMRSETNSPQFQRKTSFDPMGSLRRFVGVGGNVQRAQSPSMNQRPLPPPPHQIKTDMNRPMAARFTTKHGFDNNTSASLQQLNHEDRRHSAPFPGNPGNSRMAQVGAGISREHPPQRSFSISANSRASPSSWNSAIPETVLEMSGRNPRGSETNLRGHARPTSRDTGYPGWEEDEIALARNQRAYSVSTSNLHRFPVSTSDASHFATLQRQKKPPARPPPPVPPRDFSQQHMTMRPYPQQPQMYPSASVFELDRAGAFVPWMQPGFEFQQQQAAMMGHPGTLRRTPSTSSSGGRQDFGWGMGGFGPPMTQSEMNMEIQARRENEPQLPPAYGNQHQQEQFNKAVLARNGSLRRKSQPRQFDGAQMQPLPRVPTPVLKPIRQPEPPQHVEYYSAEPEDLEPVGTFTENPEGPWSCEHCTFVNTKSTRICIICCKTPSKGYRVLPTKGGGGRNTPFNSGHKPKSESTHDDAAVVQSKLSFSNSKAQANQKISLSVEKVPKPPRSNPVEKSRFEQESESSESEEEDEITQRQPYPFQESKTPGVNGIHHEQTAWSESPKQGKQNQAKIMPKQNSVSTGVGSSPPPVPKFVDSGTGEYSVHGPIRVIKRTTEIKPKADQSTSTNKFQENRKVNNKKSMSTSTSGSSSPYPTKSFSEFDRRSSRGTSPPPQTISTQTYEEIPASKMRQPTKSISKSSILSSGELSPPRVIEMSDKAMRYARRAQQQSKLKRSMSTHLTSSSNSNDPWIDGNHHRSRSSHAHHNLEGRNMHRSSSRHSLASDTRSLPISGPPSRDGSPRRGGRYAEDFHRYPTPSWDRFPSDYFTSIEDLVVRKRRDSMRSQEFELSRLLKEAEEFNYTPEDLQTALRMCGDRNPVKWLQDNWANMIETVQTLATKYGRDKGQELNEVGTISPPEAKEALRLHRGNVWAAVTECVDQRCKKFSELQSRGSFLREDILTALTANQGNLDAAYVELSKAQLKPFLMRIWGPPSGQDNEALPPSSKSSVVDLPVSLPHAEKKVLVTQPEVGLNANKSEPISSALKSAANVTMAKSVPEPPKQTQVEIITKVVPSEVNVQMDEQQVKVPDPDLEDDAFPDIFFDPEPVKSELERAHSLSDPEPELDESEAHVSDFIQNFEVPPPPPSPLIPPLNDSTTKTQGTGNTPPSAMKQNSDEKNNEQALAALTQAVNAITEKLGTLFQQQQSLSSSVNTSKSPTDERSPITPPQPPAPMNDETQVNKIGKVRVENPLSGSSLPIQPNEVLALKDIYRDELKVLKQIVLDNETEKGHAEGQTSQVPKIPETKPVVKSGPSKLYEVLGNFAGSILGRKTPKPKPEENIYETVKVEKVHQNEILATLLQDQIRAHTTESPVASTSTSRVSETETSEKKTIPEKVNQNEILAALFQEKIVACVTSTTPKSEFTLPSTSRNTTASEVVTLKEVVNEPEPDEDQLGSGTSSESLPVSDDEEPLTSSSSASERSQPRKALHEILSQLSHGKGASSLESSEEEEGSESVGESGDDIEEDASYAEDESENESEEDLGQVYEAVDLSQGYKVGKIAAPSPAVVPGSDPPEVKPSISKPLQPDEPTPTTADPLPPQLPIQVPKTKNELGIQKLLSSGQVKTEQKAELAMTLMDMNFPEEDSLVAAQECSSLYAAISFLQQDCFLCAGKLSAKQMVSMLRCTHRCCRTCAAEYFTVQIRDHSIVDCTCPFCKEPSNLSEETDQAPDYFSHLDMLLKDLLEVKVHEMFQRKLRDWTLAKTPNFKWCSKCSSGFITEPLQTHLVCPDCNAVTCAICLEPWDKFNHDHRDRGDLSRFCDTNMNSAGAEPKSSIDYLNENCIECPRCHLKFALARGGCMHLTCSQCRYEFCSGCTAPFRMGAKCSENSPFCAKLGLHAHHPRNCLFYLRDKEPEILAALLKENKVTFQTGAALVDSGGPTVEIPRSALKCKVPIQKETESGIVDDLCGQETSRELPNICPIHYVEYLGLLIWQNHLDPISILTSDDLETIIKRAHKKLPPKPYGIKDIEYRPQLLKVIGAEIPL